MDAGSIDNRVAVLERTTEMHRDMIEELRGEAEKTLVMAYPSRRLYEVQVHDSRKAVVLTVWAVSCSDAHGQVRIMLDTLGLDERTIGAVYGVEES